MPNFMNRNACLLMVVLCLVWSNLSWAQSVSDVKAYIKKYEQIALKQEREFGVPASIILAQGILESGAGTSSLIRMAKNHFGIKAYGGWTGDVYLAWDDEQSKSRFRKYKSDLASFEDHSKFLRENKRYQKLFAISVYDYRGWALGLQRAGYATASHYAKALIGYIDAYKLYAINGGVKLRPGKTVVLVRQVKTEKPVFDADCQILETEKTEEDRQIDRIFRRFVVEINEVRCTILYPGETLSSVSKKYDISKSDLLAYNEVGNESGFKEGDIVFLEEKKERYEGAQDYYKVREHDTMYGISQQFGVKLASLIRMNARDFFSELKAGEMLKLK